MPVVDPSVLTVEEERPVRVRSREGELLSCTPKAARSAGTLRHMIDDSAGGSCPVDVPAVALRVVLDACNDEDSGFSRMESHSLEELFAVMVAANYLDAPGAFGAAARQLSIRFLAGKTVEELRTSLGAEDDMSQAEQAAALAEPAFTPQPQEPAEESTTGPPCPQRGASLLAGPDVLEAMLQQADAAALCQLKAVSVAWRTHARRELCNRLCRREGQPKPTGLGSITDLDVEGLALTGRPWEVVVAGRELPQLARLHGFGFVVDVHAVREADLDPEEDDDDDDDDDDGDDDDAPLGGTALRSCIGGEGDPPRELLFAAVACAACGTVCGVPVQELRDDNAIDSLNLDESGLGVIGAVLLGLMLPALRSVRSLSLYSTGIGDMGATALAAILNKTKITELELGGNTIGDKGGSAFAAILKETQITELHLGHNAIGDEGASALAAILNETMISTLKLWGNQVGAEGAAALADILHKTNITNLDLGGNNLASNYGKDVSGVLKLVEVLPLTKIESVNLANNRLCGVDKNGEGTYTAEVIIKLFEALKESAVTSLSLTANFLGPDGGAALAEGLKGNSTLQSLDLGYNTLCGINESGKGTYTTEGIAKLCEAVKGSAVTSLTLYRNHLCGLDDDGRGTYTTEGITKLCEALKGSAVTSLKVDHEALQIDELSGTKPTERIDLSGKGGLYRVASAIIIASCIKGNGVLKELNLGGNNLTNHGETMSGLLQLVEVLPQTRIQSFDLANTFICGIGNSVRGTYTTECISKLCEALKGSVVTSLNLAGNNLTNNGKDMSGLLKLVEILPLTKIESLGLAANRLDDHAKHAVKQHAASSGVAIHF